MSEVHEAAARIKDGPASVNIADFGIVAHWALPLLDETPIDESWLRSVGFIGGNKWPNGFGYMELEAGQNTITVSEPVDGTEEWVVGGERIPHSLMPDNRGSARIILKKLGIHLTEKASTNG